MTMKQQYQNNNQQQEQHQQHTTSTSTSSNTRSRAYSNEPLINMQVEELNPIYEHMFGRGIPLPIGDYFGRLIRAGMEPAVIASAINATAWARVPTPFYMRAILQRYLADGLMTIDQLNHDMMEKDTERREQREGIEERMYF